MTDDYDALDKIADNLNKKQIKLLESRYSPKQLYYWWFMSFQEHLNSCDMCTLTWSKDFCDDYKLLLEIIKLGDNV